MVEGSQFNKTAASLVVSSSVMNPYSILRDIEAYFIEK